MSLTIVIEENFGLENSVLDLSQVAATADALKLLNLILLSTPRTREEHINSVLPVPSVYLYISVSCDEATLVW